MKYSTRIKSISYLKANAAEIVRELAEQREPLVITQNGEAKAVIQGCRILRGNSGKDGNAQDFGPRQPADRGGQGRLSRRCHPALARQEEESGLKRFEVSLTEDAARDLEERLHCGARRPLERGARRARKLRLKAPVRMPMRGALLVLKKLKLGMIGVTVEET